MYDSWIWQVESKKLNTQAKADYERGLMGVWINFNNNLPHCSCGQDAIIRHKHIFEVIHWINNGPQWSWKKLVLITWQVPGDPGHRYKPFPSISWIFLRSSTLFLTKITLMRRLSISKRFHSETFQTHDQRLSTFPSQAGIVTAPIVLKMFHISLIPSPWGSGPVVAKMPPGAR